MITGYKVEYKGREYEVEHGDAFDRGSADSYYNRARRPHRGGVGGDSGPLKINLTAREIADYMAGYDWNEANGDKKDWN
jgi:hypothetical protein